MNYLYLLLGGISLIVLLALLIAFFLRYEDRNILKGYEKRKEFVKVLIKEVLQELHLTNKPKSNNHQKKPNNNNNQKKTENNNNHKKP